MIYVENKTNDGRLNKMALQISRILHAGYLIENKRTSIVFDPIFENPFSFNCHAFPEIEFDQKTIRNLKPNAVFISHYHDDHCSLNSLSLINRHTPIYIYCLHNQLFDWIRQLGFTKVFPLELNQTIQIDHFKVTAIKALDMDVDCIFHIECAGLNILNVVDSWIDSETLQRLSRTNWDLILWPFQTMREIEALMPHASEKAIRSLPPEWLEQLQILKPKNIVPSSCQFIQESWSWLRTFYFPISYKQFEKEIKSILPKTYVIRLNPGSSISLDSSTIKKAASLSWITPLGDQNVDYEIDESLNIQSTSDIAKNLSQITNEQLQMVYDFCKKLNSESWQLNVYDHQGKVKSFNFFKDHPAWITEIPASKLYSALIHGESLSSLYLRVILKPDWADALEDPLINALYKDPLSYQKAQLNQLLKN